MIQAWLFKKALFDLPRWAWVLIVVAGLFLLGLWLAGGDEEQQEIGATIQREGDLRETLKRVEKGNEVRENVRRNSSAAYDECVQSARTPSNCIGLLPPNTADQF